MRRKTWLATTALAVAAAICLPSVPWAGEELVGRLEKGQERLQEICGRCHSVDTPLAKEVDRAAWDALLVQMVERGAKVSPEDKDLIINYLVARYLFSSRCTVCHTKERIYDRERAFRQWEQTVKDMAAKSPELLTKEEADLLVAYLTVVLGPGSGEK